MNKISDETLEEAEYMDMIEYFDILFSKKVDFNDFRFRFIQELDDRIKKVCHVELTWELT